MESYHASLPSPELLQLAQAVPTFCAILLTSSSRRPSCVRGSDAMNYPVVSRDIAKLCANSVVITYLLLQAVLLLLAAVLPLLPHRRLARDPVETNPHMVAGVTACA